MDLVGKTEISAVNVKTSFRWNELKTKGRLLGNKVSEIGEKLPSWLIHNC